MLRSLSGRYGRFATITSARPGNGSRRLPRRTSILPPSPARWALSLASSTAAGLVSVAQTEARGAALAIASAIAPDPVPTSTTTPGSPARWFVAQATSPVLVSRGVITKGLVASSSPPKVVIARSIVLSLYQRSVFRDCAVQLEHDLARRVIVEAVPRLAPDLADL